jgi:outer membrane protein assembly factor BamB
MPSRFQSFSEVRYNNTFQGYPCIASVSQNEVVVGDWSGNLLRATLSPFDVQKRVFVASKVGETLDLVVCNTLRSLALNPKDPMLCAVATRGNHAAVWDSRQDNVTRVITHNGPVNSVAWLDAEYLLIGTGYYSLTEGVTPQAQLDVWKIDKEEPSSFVVVALPGICVDAIALCQDDNNHIVAFSGMKAQNLGFVSILDANSFLPQVVFDLPFALVGRLECVDELIFVSHSGKVSAISRKDGTEKWVHKIVGEIADFAYDADYHQLLLSNGELIAAGNGRVVETWPVLADCCCVRPRPEGGFVAVSKTGVVGVWNVNS